VNVDKYFQEDSGKDRNDTLEDHHNLINTQNQNQNKMHLDDQHQHHQPQQKFISHDVNKINIFKKLRKDLNLVLSIPT